MLERVDIIRTCMDVVVQCHHRVCRLTRGLYHMGIDIVGGNAVACYLWGRLRVCS